MKILDLEQRSEEWLHFREGKISGSKAKDLNKTRYIKKDELVAFAKSKGYHPKTADTIEKIRGMMTQSENDELDLGIEMTDAIYKLIAEKIAKPINPNDYEDRLDGRPFSLMIRGELLEAEALETFNEQEGLNATAGRVWQSDENENIICSPDGEIEIDGKITEAVEIKCLDSWKMVRQHYEGDYPKDYHDQVLQYFLVNQDLEILHFVLYSDVFAATPEIGYQVYDIYREDVEDELEFIARRQNAILKLVEEEVKELVF